MLGFRHLLLGWIIWVCLSTFGIQNSSLASRTNNGRISRGLYPDVDKIEVDSAAGQIGNGGQRQKRDADGTNTASTAPAGVEMRQARPNPQFEEMHEKAREEFNKCKANFNIPYDGTCVERVRRQAEEPEAKQDYAQIIKAEKAICRRSPKVSTCDESGKCTCFPPCPDDAQALNVTATCKKEYHKEEVFNKRTLNLDKGVKSFEGCFVNFNILRDEDCLPEGGEEFKALKAEYHKILGEKNGKPEDLTLAEIKKFHSKRCQRPAECGRNDKCTCDGDVISTCRDEVKPLNKDATCETERKGLQSAAKDRDDIDKIMNELKIIEGGGTPGADSANSTAGSFFQTWPLNYRRGSHIEFLSFAVFICSMSVGFHFAALKLQSSTLHL